MCGSPNSGGYEIMSPRQGFGHGAPMTIGLAAVAVIGFKITATVPPVFPVSWGVSGMWIWNYTFLLETNLPKIELIPQSDSSDDLPTKNSICPLSEEKISVAVQAFSVFHSPMVRRSGSKLMPTFTMGNPERANLEA